MIKALLLVLNPAATWDRIALAKRSWPVILLGYLFPLWVIGAIAEGYGLVRRVNRTWGCFCDQDLSQFNRSPF